MSWYSNLPRWQQGFTFIGGMFVAGTTIVSTGAFIERRAGIIAEHFGFARTVTVRESVDNLKAWQLYSDIRRLDRQIVAFGVPDDEIEATLLKDLKDQLAVIQHEYDRITKKK